MPSKRRKVYTKNGVESQPLSLSRSTFIRGAAGLGVAAIAGGLIYAISGRKPGTQEPSYYTSQSRTFSRSDFEPFAGLHEINGEVFATLIDTLKTAIGDPVAVRTAESLLKLSEDVPPENIGLPHFVDSNALPVPIALVSSPISQVSYLKHPQDTIPDFRVSSDGNTFVDGFNIGTISFGISLTDGTGSSLEQAPIEQQYIGVSNFAMKEMLSLQIGLALAMGNYDITTIPGKETAFYTELDGSPITDREKQIMAGASFYFHQLTTRSTDSWKTVDAFPIFCTALSYMRQLSDGKMPGQAPLYGMGNFIKAIDVMNRYGIRDRIAGFMNDWLRSGQLIPDPYKTNSTVYQRDVHEACLELNSIIYP